MKKRIAMSFLLLFLAEVPLAYAGESVTFKGTGEARTPLILTGKLTKPQGNGPFPAVVLLHGCEGIMANRDDLWAERLASWGYVTFQVDSFGPRGLSSICEDVALVFSTIAQRAQDTYDAKSYLTGLPFVDRNRIAVMGWSHGGGTTISVIAQKRNDPFRSAIAFYPYCDQPLVDLNAPLLILIGEKDRWTPAISCSLRMPREQTKPEVVLKIYPDSHHGFDAEGLDRHIMGFRLLSNPVAAADAIIQVKAFLNKHLK